MKPTIFVKGATDAMILRAILPADLLRACSLVLIPERSTPVSVARTHLIKYGTPTALMLDTDTLNATLIADMVQTTRYLMAEAAVGTPFDVIYYVPHIEAIFFEDTSGLERIFPDFKNAFILQFARTQPKAQLEVLLQRGGGPNDLDGFLSSLTTEEVEKVRSASPIKQVIEFITVNAKVAASKP
jgi:hypothetical protein